MKIANRDSEVRLAGIINSAMDAIITVDSNQKIVLFNHAAELMFRCTANEMMGSPLEQLIPVRYREMHRKHIQDFGLTGVTMRRMGALQEISGLRVDGQEFPVEASISQIETGGKKFFTVILRDLSERHHAEQALQESEARYRALVEQASDGIFIADREGRYIEVNPAGCSLLGYTREELLQKTLRDVTFPDPKAPLRLDELRQGKVIITERQLIRKDGTLVPIEISAKQLSDGSLQGIVRDITDRKRAETEIRELNEHLEYLVEARTMQLQTVNQELDAFAYVVSHDLKAPLRGITQLASWLLTDYAQRLDEEGSKMLSLMVNRSKRMHDMIEGILQYSRIGRMKDSPIQIDLNTLVGEVIDVLNVPEGVEISVAPDLPSVYADETRLRQVFQNLIGNAVKYMHKPTGKISVSWRDQEDYWQFAVADNGPGIAPQYHEKVFQIFQTLTPRDEVESTGIGLALVKKIVELHRGRVWLESVEGQGATFYFILPKENRGNRDEKL